MQKKELRLYYLNVRSSLTQLRKSEASASACTFLKEICAKFHTILSFASLNNEINLWEFNEYLVKKEMLFLPRIEKKELEIYHIHDIKKDLVTHPFLSIEEPNPLVCEKIPPKCLDCIIVPGLAFDTHHHRLGYGKGYYDRLLFSLKKVYKIGVGFKEQLSQKPLPHNGYDCVLDAVYLF